MKVIAGALAIVLLSARGDMVRAPRVPVLLELFTSEGCSSCPPADALLAALERDQPVAAAEIIPLGLHVDYWDQLGWRDAFSSPAFTSRQQAYTPVLGGKGPYTPQMVVDGREGFVGSDREAAERAIAAAAARPHLPLHVTARGMGDNVRLTIDLPAAGAGAAEPVQVIAALTQSGLTSVVRRGENSGRTLQHVAVTRKVQVLGALEPDAYVAEGQWRLERGWDVPNLKVVVWLQGARTRHVYAAASAPVAR